jgi:hypothetical protein
VAEIGDIARFLDARELCARSGGDPIVSNSDQTVRQGGNTQLWIRLRIVEELSLLYEFGNGGMDYRLRGTGAG